MHGMYGQHTTQRSNFCQQQKTENLGLTREVSFHATLNP